MIDDGFEVKCYDSYAREFKYPLHSLDEAIDKADIIVVLAEHNEYRDFNEDDIKNIASKVRNEAILDTKNILKRDLWEEEGFKVYVLGDGKNA